MKEIIVYGSLIFYITSFIGYIVEVFWIYLATKKLVNRGFLCGPLIPIYGIGAVLILFSLFRYYDDPIVVFVFGVIIASCLEYFTSFIMEKLFSNRWWDYSDKKYNLNGRICLKNSLLFGVMSLVIVYFLMPILHSLFNLFSFKVWLIIDIVITIIFIADVIYSCIVAYNLRNRIIIVEELKNEKLAQIPIIFEQKLKKSIEGFKTFPNRLLKAFPTLEQVNHKSFVLMQEYKEQAALRRKELKEKHRLAKKKLKAKKKEIKKENKKS